MDSAARLRRRATRGGFDLAARRSSRRPSTARCRCRTSSASRHSRSPRRRFEVTDRQLALDLLGSRRPTANEIFVDQLARARGEDEVAFRLQHLTDRPARAPCLQQVADRGRLGRSAAVGPRARRGDPRRVPLGGRLSRRDRRREPGRPAPDARVRGGRRGRSDQPEGPRGADPGRPDRRLVDDVPRGQPPRQRRDPRGQLSATSCGRA